MFQFGRIRFVFRVEGSQTYFHPFLFSCAIHVTDSDEVGNSYFGGTSSESERDMTVGSRSVSISKRIQH